MESLTFEDAVNQTIKYLIDMGENTTAIDLNTVYDYANRIDMYIYDFFPKNYKLSKIDDNRIKEFVNYMAELRKVKGKVKKERTQQVLKETGLDTMQNKLIKNLSRGQKQRVSLAGTLVADPKI